MSDMITQDTCSICGKAVRYVRDNGVIEHNGSEPSGPVLLHAEHADGTHGHFGTGWQAAINVLVADTGCGIHPHTRNPFCSICRAHDDRHLHAVDRAVRDMETRNSSESGS
jgi:hypothetical protein